MTPQYVEDFLSCHGASQTFYTILKVLPIVLPIVQGLLRKIHVLFSCMFGRVGNSTVCKDIGYVQQYAKIKEIKYEKKMRRYAKMANCCNKQRRLYRRNRLFAFAIMMFFYSPFCLMVAAYIADSWLNFATWDIVHNMDETTTTKLDCVTELKKKSTQLNRHAPIHAPAIWIT